MKLINFVTYLILFIVLFAAILIFAIAVSSAFRKSKAIKKMRDWFDKLSGNGNGVEFEDFLEMFFIKSGWNVKRPTNSTNTPDFGVDLILGGKIAIQAKNYAANVDNSAVQQVLSGMLYWKNNGFPSLKYAVVISTSAFTSSAKKQANSTGVILKDGNDLRNVLNKKMYKNWVFKKEES